MYELLGPRISDEVHGNTLEDIFMFIKMFVLYFQYRFTLKTNVKIYRKMSYLKSFFLIYTDVSLDKYF